MTRPRGRPHRNRAPASRERILDAALELLDTGGIEGFTMRALADRLQVNPMTIYHHFGDRDGLVDALSEHVYAEVSAPASGAFLERMRSLLQAYHERVLAHPGLTLLIFSQPAVFPRQAQRITDEIKLLLAEAGLPSAMSRLWLNILVDFTHGAAIASAMGDRSSSATRDAKEDYDKTLSVLLKGLNT
ncbi:TetR/AcrR family transcriptional regulator [Nitratireductor basaltis]|uniref:Transcriptional regulator, TetR family n=1 Tax=Nitratireductor basaltis TaxID=472175 RepID=A0A084UEN8_9HYPH|nr:TetR/AcrR family transcriptional regulator [Nitratireductor basaltis]KFB11424.1 Transcriptional regulator, TetR family [Nitratireductor basaltis]